MAKNVDASFDDQNPKSSFARSMKVGPIDFLTGGETPEQAKTRIAAIVTEVVEKGLSMRDGVLHFGVSPSDMTDAKTALGSLKDDDTNYMRHSNDSLMNAMGCFVLAYQKSQMPLEKSQAKVVDVAGWDAEKTQKQISESQLPAIKAYLGGMHECGFDKSVQPRRWDSCGGFGVPPRECHDAYRDVLPQRRRDRESRQGGLHLGLGSK